jgi:uncharacterized repeat protein (TIGR03803 family)
LYNLHKALVAGCFSAAALLAFLHAAQASKGFSILYQFCQQNDCTDGATPYAGLIADKAGNLYGTTTAGGVNGWGTVFKVAPNGIETVLYSFCAQTNCADGAYPRSSLLLDQSGNLYGTTSEGGTMYDLGTVFKLAPNGTETVLYAFGTHYGDGATPWWGVIMDSKGNLYGTTVYGYLGRKGGTVFELTPNGTETTLYSFCSYGYPVCTDGESPTSVIRDEKGNLYGTTASGGANSSDSCDSGAGQDFGCGTVFEVTSKGVEIVLYSFCAQAGCSDGETPYAGLVKDNAGNLYGTTYEGGLSGCSSNNFGCGTVFELAPNGTETVLYSFCS